MDDSGEMRAHGELSAEVKANVSLDLGTGTTSATVRQTQRKDAAPPVAGQLAKVADLTLNAVEEPDEGPCGKKLLLTGMFSVDGPAMIDYRFYASEGDVLFPGRASGTMDATGNAALTTEAVFPRSLQGELRLQVSVQGTAGHNGPPQISEAVPFQVTCVAK